ncbi:hypothetical protein ACFLU3_04665 [Chloroflexota bacterium]
MTIEVYYDNENDCVIGRLIGVADRQTFIDYANEVMSVVSQYDCGRFLNDLRRTEPAMSTKELSSFPDELEKIMSSKKIYKTKWYRAVVVSEDPKYFGHALYYEVASRNRGHFESTFTDINEAMSWLKSVSL